SHHTGERSLVNPHCCPLSLWSFMPAFVSKVVVTAETPSADSAEGVSACNARPASAVVVTTTNRGYLITSVPATAAPSSTRGGKRPSPTHSGRASPCRSAPPTTG